VNTRTGPYARVILYAALIGFAMLFLMPAYMTVITALKDPADIRLDTAWEVPSKLNWSSFSEAAEKLHEGTRYGPYRYGLHKEGEKSFVFLGKSLSFMILHPEGLDDPGSGNSLLKEAGKTSHGDLSLCGVLPHLLAEFGDRIDGERKYEGRYYGEFPVTIKDDKDESEKGEGILQKTRNGF